MKNKVFLIICAILRLFLVLCSCGGGDNPSNSTDHTHTSGGHTHTSGSSNGGTSGLPSDNIPNNPGVNAPQTSCPSNENGHYWHDVTVKNGSISGSLEVYGTCYACGDRLYKESISIVSYEEWKSALSVQGLECFTLYSNGEYTDYTPSGSMTWRIKNNIYTSDYFVNSQEKNSSAYAKNFSGYLLMFNDFKYNSETRTYVYKVNDESRVELGFADGKLLSHSVITKHGEGEQKTLTLYLNYGIASSDVHDYFFNLFSSLYAQGDGIFESSLSDTQKNKIAAFLSSVSFDISYEISYLENDEISIYFDFGEERTDDIFGNNYSTASVIIKDSRLVTLTIGTSSIEITY